MAFICKRLLARCIENDPAYSAEMITFPHTSYQFREKSRSASRSSTDPPTEIRPQDNHGPCNVPITLAFLGSLASHEHLQKQRARGFERQPCG